MVQARKDVLVKEWKKELEIIADTTQFSIEKETAVAIGKFDGIHTGDY